MDKNFYLGRALLLLLFFAWSTGSAQSISGKVVDEMTSEPLPGVLVNIVGTAFQEKTDAAGYFSFSDLPALGETILMFSKNGFFEKGFPVTFISEGFDLATIFLKPDMLEVQQQAAIVSLSDQELDEEDGSYSNVSGLLQASRDVFLNAAAFDFSATFFRPRGYDSEWGKVMINGVEMNKFFNGRPLWSNWGGLNDVQRNQVFSMGTSASDVSFGSLAGTTNIIMKASEYAQGGKFSYAVANRSYTGRIMGSYHSGLTESGWAYSISLARRFAEESFIDGTFYDANSFFVSVEKKFDEDHSLNFTAFYTPNQRGKNSPNTQEVYDLKGNRYNAYWGFQDGEIRNARIKNVEEPVIMLNHTWQISHRTEVNSNAAFQFGKTGNSRIDYGGSRLFTGSNGENAFFGGGSNPDPAYYQKLPSFFMRFEDRQNFQEAYLAQQEFQKNGQIDWAALYLANQTLAETGGNALYVLYEDRNDDQQFSGNVILRTEVNSHFTINAALRYKKLQSENFANVLDLFGGAAYLDVDSFSEGSEAQNDLLNPNRLVQENEIFKYHYNLSAMALEGFGQVQFYFKNLDGYAAVDLSHTGYQRDGVFKNGNFPNNSLGESEPVGFENYGGKIGLTYKLTGRHLFNINAAHFTKPPALRNAFSNARQNNDVVQDIGSEKVMAGDIGYIFRTPKIKGRITGFYGLFEDATEVSFYYADGLSGLGRDTTTAFVQEVLTGIDKRHVGIETGVEAQVTQSIKLKMAASLGEYIYNNNPNLYLTSDDFTEAKQMGKSLLKNYRIPGGPQRAAQVGFEYRDPDYWWVSGTANFFSEAFVDVAPLSRTRNFFTDLDGLPLLGYDEEIAATLLAQEELDSYMLVNLVGGKSWRLQSRFIGIFGSINNILNASYKTGGYEQSRNVNYRLLKTDFERDQPLFGPKYWFGTGTTYYAHVYYRF